VAGRGHAPLFNPLARQLPAVVAGRRARRTTVGLGPDSLALRHL